MDMFVEEYRLVKADKVNDLIKDGWQPWGSAVSVVVGMGVTFYQPIVKYRYLRS
jgi:hypothetical protein